MAALPDKEHKQTAACACGAVTVTLSGPPRSMLHCACLDCQKSSGAGHAPLIMMRDTDVQISGPTAAHAVTAASGATTTRQFCPVCGNPVGGSSTRSPGIVFVPVGLFGDVSWFAPRAVIFARSLMDWDEIDASIPRYNTYRS